MVSVSSGNIAARPSERGGIRSYGGTSASNGPGGGTEAVNLLRGLLPRLGGFKVLGSKESKPNDPNGSDAITVNLATEIDR